jgi:pyruvate,water dikinase
VPLVADGEDVAAAREALGSAGIDTGERTWGTMVETPASALVIEDILAEGVDFVSFGTNDLTQYVLAVDRNNERVADRYDETHPAVLRLLDECIAACREHGVEAAICGQAASRPEMVRHLIEAGIDSLSVDVDAVGDVRRAAARAERGLLLESARR